MFFRRRKTSKVRRNDENFATAAKVGELSVNEGNKMMELRPSPGASTPIFTLIFLVDDFHLDSPSLRIPAQLHS